MKLPFRYQFILAPSIIVFMLAALVAYTLVELANINAANEVTRQSAIVLDRNLTALSGITRLNQIIHAINSQHDLQQDDNYFSYLEQARILSDVLTDPYLLGQLSPELQQQVNQSEHLLRKPEHVDTAVLSHSLSALSPLLEHQQKIFSAQRRASYIDFHRKLLIIISRLSTVLLTVLLLCIAVATGLGLWGLHVIRRRLTQLSDNARAAHGGAPAPITHPNFARDELDELDIYLASMTTRLLHVVSVENVLRGVENERRRIAMDMHDGVLADLTAINRKLDSLSNDSSERDEIHTVRTEVDDIIRNLRRTIDDLHPQVLEILGLESALRSLLERYSAVTDFPHYHIEFDPIIETVIPLHYKLNLFRILTEAINNVVKHARCERFEVSLRLLAQQLLVSVEDNGIGMQLTENLTSHGCANITERAQLIGATVQWRTARFATGTCFELTLSLPVPE